MTSTIRQVGINKDVVLSGAGNKRYCYLNYNNIEDLWGGVLIMSSTSIWLQPLKGNNTSVNDIRQVTNIENATPPSVTVDTTNNRIVIDYGTVWSHDCEILFGQAKQTAAISYA